MILELFYISKYRTEIMGYAILGVMLAHIKGICGFPDTIINKLLGVFCFSVFTGGFVFLTGVGLCFSLHKDGNLKRFYMKRIKRLLISYWIISTPYFLYTDLYLNSDVVAFIEHVITISFWLQGNYSGMWYIAMTVVIYLIYPFMHKFMYGGKMQTIYAVVILLGSYMIVNKALLTYAPIFYHNTEIAITKFPFLILGSLTMNYDTEWCKILNIRWISWLSVGCIILLVEPINTIWLTFNAISIIVLGYLYEVCNRSGYISWINGLFRWLGKYTLELYILHLLVYYLLNLIIVSPDEGLNIIMGVMIALIFCKPMHLVTEKITR